MIVVFEGLILSFWLLLICVVGMAKEGPVGLVLLYDSSSFKLGSSSFFYSISSWREWYFIILKGNSIQLLLTFNNSYDSCNSYLQS